MSQTPPNSLLCQECPYKQKALSNADYDRLVALSQKDAVSLLIEARDAFRGKNSDAWFCQNIDRVNAVIDKHIR